METSSPGVLPEAENCTTCLKQLWSAVGKRRVHASLGHFVSLRLAWGCRLMVWKCIVGFLCCCCAVFSWQLSISSSWRFLLEDQLPSLLYPGRFEATQWGNPHTAPESELMCVCVCVRNLSSAGEEARSQLRCCEGLVDSLLHVLRACVNTSDYDSKVQQSTNTQRCTWVCESCFVTVYPRESHPNLTWPRHSWNRTLGTWIWSLNTHILQYVQTTATETAVIRMPCQLLSYHYMWLYVARPHKRTIHVFRCYAFINSTTILTTRVQRFTSGCDEMFSGVCWCLAFAVCF